MEIIYSPDEKFWIVPVDNFPLYLVKFGGALALQMMMAPSIRKNLKFIKFINNHPELFDAQFFCISAALM